MITNDKLKLLKPGDMFTGSSVWSDYSKDIDVYCSDINNKQYYLDLGFDVLTHHPREYMFTFQCIGQDSEGIHYFHPLAKMSIEEKSVYINENGVNFNKTNLVKVLAKWPQWSFEPQAIILCLEGLPKEIINKYVG